MDKTVAFFCAAASVVGTCLAASVDKTADGQPMATFRSFELKGEETLPPCDVTRQYRNPIMDGMAPDPSITRKGGDYYLAQSSFSYFPGIPVWHSKNLVDWDFSGYVGASPSQLNLKEGVGLSAGVFAPDIKYNPYNDTFYLIVTVIGDRGNVVYKSKDPAKGWSNPIPVPVGGIDPSFFFEDDKTAWILNNDDAPDGKAEYPGHRTVRMRKYDLLADKVIPGTERIIINKGVNPAERPIWCEGPHLYKIDGTYYVMTAEGGTAWNHSEVIWRSDKVEGPYVPCPVNPILTQRDLGSDVPGAVTSAGHADIIQTPEGDWYAVFLAIPPYRVGNRDFCPTGRSTFLLPVKWIGEGKARQPMILEKGKRIPLVCDLPAAAVGATPARRSGNRVERDEFAAAEVDPMWFQVRTPSEKWFASSVAGNPGLTIKARPVSIYGQGNPSFLCRWLRSRSFTTSVSVEFNAASKDELAGLVLYQNEKCNYVLGKTADENGAAVVKLEKHDKSGRSLVASARLPQCAAGKPISLRAVGRNEKVTFGWSLDGANWTGIGGEEDATILTTDYAGGFVGATIGLYATSAAAK